MNRFEKAAEFGAMMGKRAADFNTKIQGNTALGSGPSSPQQPKLTLPPSAGPYGGPANKVGTLPGASTTQRVPQLGTSQKLKIPYNSSPRPPLGNTIGGANPSGRPKELSKNPNGTSQDNNYINFLNTNYSRMGNPNNPNQLVPPGLGTSRQQFHTSLSTQLDDNGANTNPLNSNYSRWSERMREIAKDTSEQAPISHYSLSEPSDLNNWPRGEGPSRLSGMPAHAGSRLPSAYTDPKRDESGQWSPGQNMAPAGQYAYVPKNDTFTNKLTEWATGMPRTITNPNMTKAHEFTHSGWQDQEGGLQFTDNQGKPMPPNPRGTYYAGNPMLPHMVSAESGAVFNEIGQGARAFKDVTGKNMEGDYNFSPEVSMSNRELGEYAKKYKPTDLNSPAGQLFLRRILETSK